MADEKKVEEIKKTVIKGFSTKKSLDYYSSLGGLLGAEKHFCSKYFGTGTRILDLGCGAGRTSFALATTGHEVVAIDIVPEMIDAANKKKEELKANRVEFRVGDVMELEFNDESFDNAFFSRNGIEYIPGSENREKVMGEVWRVLKPNGYFIFTTMNLLYFDSGKQWAKLLPQYISYRLKKLAGKDPGIVEFGDFYYDHEWVGGVRNFQHNCNPFIIKNQLIRVGFEVVEYMPEQWLLKGQKYNFLAHFASGRHYYIARKKAGREIA